MWIDLMRKKGIDFTKTFVLVNSIISQVPLLY